MAQGPISYSDLYLSDVQSGIKEVNALTKETDKIFQDLAKTLTSTSDRVTSSIKSETEALTGLHSIVSKIDVTQKGAADSLTKLATEVDTATAKTRNLKDQQEGLNKIYSVSTQELNRLQDRTKELTKEYELLAASTGKNDVKLKALSKEITATVTAQNRLASAMGLSKKSIDAAEGSYNKLNLQLKQARIDLNALPNAVDKVTGAINKNNPVAVAMAKNIQQLDYAVKKYDATLGNHQRNVGNYSSALSGVGSQLASLAAGYVSIAAALGAVSSTFDTALKIDSIRTVLEYTFKSAEVAEQKLQDLQKAADRLGLEFVPLADSYKKFTAAAIAANFPIKEAEKLFYATATAGARLKLSTDEVEGSMRAFVQMISKGTVQAEELRGQLGDRLYGAFSITAKAMGVTERALNDMLKKGEVLAADLLPKLATELEKSFGLKQGERVEGLQAAVNKLSNVFTTMVANNSNISKFFETIVNGIADVFGGIKDMVNSKSWEEFLFFALPHKQGEKFGVSMVESRAAQVESFKKMPMAQQKQEMSKISAVLKVNMGAGEIDIAREQFKTLQALRGAYNELYLAKKPVIEQEEKEEKKKEKQLNALEQLEKKIKDITEAMQLAYLANPKFAMSAQTSAFLADLQEKLRYAQSFGRGADLPDASMGGANVDQYQTFVGSRGKIEKQPGKELSAEEKAKRLHDALNNLMPLLRQSNEIIGELFGEKFGDLMSQVTDNLEKMLDPLEKAKMSFVDWAKTANAAVAAINEGFQHGSELRIEALQLEKQAQIDIAGTNATARLQIEKDYNEKIRAEKIKGYKEAKVAAMFTVAINTATAVIGALAPPPVGAGPILGIPFAVAAGILGAAQLALIAARPIPKFFKGREGGPGTIAEVNEQGPELLEYNGQYRIAGGGKRTVTYLRPSEKVHTAPITERILDIQQIDRNTELHSRLTKNLQDFRKQDQISTMTAAFHAARMDEKAFGREVGREISKLPLQHFQFDQRGYSQFIQTETTRTKILNERFSLK